MVHRHNMQKIQVDFIKKYYLKITVFVATLGEKRHILKLQLLKFSCKHKKTECPTQRIKTGVSEEDILYVVFIFAYVGLCEFI